MLYSNRAKRKEQAHLIGLLLLSVNLNGSIQMDILNGSKAGIGGEGITCYRIAVNGKLPGIDQRRSQALVCIVVRMVL